MARMAWWSNLSPWSRRRLGVALTAGVVSGALHSLYLWLTQERAGDFTWAWRGASLWWFGFNPYEAIQPGLDPYLKTWLFYPFPALLYALPLSGLPAEGAGGVFMGVSTGLLVWALLNDPAETPKDTLLRIGLTLCSAPFLFAWMRGQWSPLLAGAAAIPALAPLWLAKPNIGLPLFLAFFSWPRALACGVVLLVSLALFPTWPWDMWRFLGMSAVYIPMLNWYGPILLLAALRWRAPGGRLILSQSLINQRLVYDQVAFWLLPRTWRQTLALSAGSWLGLALVLAGLEPVWSAPPIYLAALGVLFWQTRPVQSPGPDKGL